MHNVYNVTHTQGNLKFESKFCQILGSFLSFFFLFFFVVAKFFFRFYLLFADDCIYLRPKLATKIQIDNMQTKTKFLQKERNHRWCCVCVNDEYIFFEEFTTTDEKDVCLRQQRAL